MLLERIFKRFLPPDLNDESRWRGRLTIGIAWMLAAVGFAGLMLRALSASLPAGALALGLIAIILWALVPPVMRFFSSVVTGAVLILIGMFTVLLGAATFSGGLGSPGLALLPLLPLIATMLVGRRLGLLTGVGVLLIVAIFGQLHSSGQVAEAWFLFGAEEWRHARTVLLLVAAAFSILIAWFYEEQTDHYRGRLESQEAYYRRFVETSPVASYRCRPDGTIVDCNDAFARLFGMPGPEEAVGLASSLLQAGTDDSATDLTSSISYERHMRDGQLSREARFRKWDGEIFWGLETINADLEDTLGAPMVEVSLMDVTARKEKAIALERSQAELQASEARYRDLFENSYDMIQSVRADGKIEYANPAWKKTLGYGEEDLQRITIFDVIHPEDQEHCGEIFQRLYAGEDPDMIEARFVARGGRTIRIEGRASCRYADGIPVATRGIFRDVTARREVEELKDQLIATVSHELRTPLTSISGALQVVSRGRSQGRWGEKSERFLEVARRNVDRMMHLVNDLLSYQRIQAGMMTSELQQLEFDERVREAVESNQGFAENFAADLVFQPGSGALVVADRGWISQVVANLVSNAIKFSPSGGQVVVSTASLDDGTVQLSVADRGFGIPDRFRDRIFEPFSQAHAIEPSFNTRVGTQEKSPQGTGLGLSICKALVEQMHGEISFESVEGEGTTFFVTLPCLNKGDLAATASVEVGYSEKTK